MKEKCNKYESLFIFGFDDDLKQHLADCPDCQQEYLQDQQVSSLVKELKPHFNRKKRQNKIFVQLAAVVFISFIAFFAINENNIPSTNSDLAFVKQNSEITQMGLPTDDYGLLRVD